MPSKSKGGSNAGKYKTKGPFCGPAGGAPKGTYPVNSRKRAVSALAYARNAPNPAGIRRCVCRHWSSLPACSKDSSGEWTIDIMGALDELRTMYAEGMVTLYDALSSLSELMIIEQCSAKDQSSIITYVIADHDVETAVSLFREMITTKNARR